MFGICVCGRFCSQKWGHSRKPRRQSYGTSLCRRERGNRVNNGACLLSSAGHISVVCVPLFTTTHSQFKFTAKPKVGVAYIYIYTYSSFVELEYMFAPESRVIRIETGPLFGSGNANGHDSWLMSVHDVHVCIRERSLSRMVLIWFIINCAMIILLQKYLLGPTAESHLVQTLSTGRLATYIHSCHNPYQGGQCSYNSAGSAAAVNCRLRVLLELKRQ